MRSASLDDAFAQDCDAFVHEHEDHAIDEIRRRARASGGRLHGLAVLPFVEPCAALAAELLLREQRFELARSGAGRPSSAAMILPTWLATSSPTTSASSTGPIGMPKSTAALIDERERHAFLRGVHRLVQIGHEHAIDDEARRAPAGHRQLVELAREGERRLRGAASAVRAPLTISMSGICATGLKKCRPTSRSGRASFAASGSSVMLEVLVASRAAGFMRGSRRAYSSCFASRFSKMASMTTSASGTPCAFDVGAQALARIGALRRLANALLEQLVRALERGLDVFRAAVLQRDGEAAQRAPRGDVAAHHAGADDVHVLDAAAPLPPMAFSRSCSRNTRTRLRAVSRGEEMRDGARFGLESLLAARAVIRPQIDDGVGRRVVLALRLARDLREQRRLHERAHERPAQHLLGERRPMMRRLLRDDVARGGFEIRRRHEPVDEPEPQRLVRAHGPAGEHHLHGGLHADEPHGAHRAAEARMDAELHFRQAERQALIAHGDAVAARERELEPAAEREALNRRDSGAGERFELVEHALAARGSARTRPWRS